MRQDCFGQRRTEVVDNNGGQAGGHNSYNKLAKYSEKIRRCKVDKRVKTTRENIRIVI
jgi:hypothetical protein